MTTPILHFIVRCLNDSSYGTPTEEGYYTKLANAFAKIKKPQACLSSDSDRPRRNRRFTVALCLNGKGRQKHVCTPPASQANERPLILDCANGVGAPKAAEFIKCAGAVFPCTLVNTDITGGNLNEGVCALRSPWQPQRGRRRLPTTSVLGIRSNSNVNGKEGRWPE